MKVTDDLRRLVGSLPKETLLCVRIVDRSSVRATDANRLRQTQVFRCQWMETGAKVAKFDRNISRLGVLYVKVGSRQRHVNRQLRDVLQGLQPQGSAHSRGAFS